MKFSEPSHAESGVFFELKGKKRADDVRFNPATGRMELLSDGEQILPEPVKPVVLTGRWGNAEEHLAFDKHQFNKRAQMSSETSRLSFSDISGMHVESREAAVFRRNAIPEFGLNNELLRRVLVNYLECRFFITPKPGDDLPTRLAKAEKAAKAQLPAKKAVLERLLRRYAVKKSYRLETEIQAIDTDIVMTTRGCAELVASVAYYSYALGQNSVQVAEQLQLKPPHVRQLLLRLNKTWKLMQKCGGGDLRRDLSRRERLELMNGGPLRTPFRENTPPSGQPEYRAMVYRARKHGMTLREYQRANEIATG
jgi:hypothetical protein